MSFVFNSALGAWRAFAEWFFIDTNLGEVIGAGAILCAIAFAYALTHKSTL